MGDTVNKIRLLIVDDDLEFCQALTLMVNSSPRLNCIGQAHSAAEGLAQIQALDPEVILMDEIMDGGSGIDCIKTLTTLMPKTSVVLMTGVHNPQGPIRALMAGAKGYLFKPFTRSECHEAVLHAFAGGLSLSPLASSLVSSFFRKFNALQSSRVELTLREEQVMGGFFKGLADKQIADVLKVGTATVHSHTSKIFKKLGVTSRKEAVEKYMEFGLGIQGI